MKHFTIIKIGYTAGVYGCSNEYFTLIVNNKAGKELSRTFSGMYGAEERIKAIMEQAGYKCFYTNSIYGRLKRDDIPKKCISSEYMLAIELKNQYSKEIAKTLKKETQEATQ